MDGSLGRFVCLADVERSALREKVFRTIFPETHSKDGV